MVITNIHFKVKGVPFKVIGTESLGRGLDKTEDTILNLENGKIAKIKRTDLIKYL